MDIVVRALPGQGKLSARLRDRGVNGGILFPCFGQQKAEHGAPHSGEVAVRRADPSAKDGLVMTKLGI
jgi:hypothetical protein